MIRQLSALVLLVVTFPAGADISGRIVRVLDGDTVEVLDTGNMLGFVENRRFIAGWCEIRAGFRLFRTDRIRSVTFLTERYPGDRKTLVRKWRREEDSRK
ncbi:WYL domain-containing protein [Enterobacter ludwigii]|uniref:WYL domain-containing protein n=1 Tax=Enterobacter ludwigii TaxID=299767 RepID=UPI003976254F